MYDIVSTDNDISSKNLQKYVSNKQLTKMGLNISASKEKKWERFVKVKPNGKGLYPLHDKKCKGGKEKDTDDINNLNFVNCITVPSTQTNYNNFISFIRPQNGKRANDTTNKCLLKCSHVTHNTILTQLNKTIFSKMKKENSQNRSISKLNHKLANPVTTSNINSTDCLHKIFMFPNINQALHEKDFQISSSAQIPYEYLSNILDCLLEEEQNFEFKVNPQYMSIQPEINDKMRAVVVNWLIEVHLRFKLIPDTLFLAVLIMDRYLSLKSIEKNKLQLVAVTSLLIACKYEEIFSPEVRDFVCILDRSYAKEDVIKIETDIIKRLKFEVSLPSCIKFFDIFRIEFFINRRDYFFGCYMLELSLLDSRFFKYPQSLIASTVCYIILKLHHKNEVKKVLDANVDRYYTYIKYKDTQIQDCAMDLCFWLENIKNSSYTSVYNKYSSTQFEQASTRILD